MKPSTKTPLRCSVSPDPSGPARYLHCYIHNLPRRSLHRLACGILRSASVDSHRHWVEVECDEGFSRSTRSRIGLVPEPACRAKAHLRAVERPFDPGLVGPAVQPSLGVNARTQTNCFAETFVYSLEGGRYLTFAGVVAKASASL
jgi:hypothetical protein